LCFVCETNPETIYLILPIIQLPDLGTIFFEIELGVVIGKAGRDIEEDSALDHVAGYVLALDLTAKDFLVSQNFEYKKNLHVNISHS
jgi:2-keto-4-pentenoate hydratase/2-oxohepta-3-ene-1,7-dioic acid hydratase in catechol pathway